MDLFFSTFVNKVDRKGRVSVPATFRAVLNDQSFEGIVAFPSLDYDALEATGIDTMEAISAGLDEIEHDAGDRAGCYGAEQPDHVAEPAPDDGQPTFVPPGQLAPVAYRVGVAVKSENPASRCGEQGYAVAAASESGIDIEGVLTRR